VVSEDYRLRVCSCVQNPESELSNFVLKIIRCHSMNDFRHPAKKKLRQKSPPSSVKKAIAVETSVHVFLPTIGRTFSFSKEKLFLHRLNAETELVREWIGMMAEDVSRCAELVEVSLTIFCNQDKTRKTKLQHQTVIFFLKRKHRLLPVIK